MQSGRVRSEFIHEIENLLKSEKGEKVDIAAKVYYLIMKEEERGAAFQYFLENADDIESLEKEEVEKSFTAAEVQALRNGCGKMLKENIRKIIIERHSVEDFYSELWKRVIEENSMLKTEKERQFALCYIWEDARIPYFELEDGIKMTNEEFKSIRNKKKEVIKKAIYILNAEFEQRTEIGSLLVKILDTCEDEREKAVVMAYILGSQERRVLKELFDDLRDRKEIIE